MKRTVRLVVLMVSVVSAGLVAVDGAYRMGEKRPVKGSGRSSTSLKETKKIKFPTAARGEDPEIAVMADLSERYTVPEERLRYFRGLRHGYEEIVPSLVIAREAQVEAGRVLKMRMEGKSWKIISESFFVDLKPLNKEVVEVLAPIRKVLPESALKERPQTRE